MPWIPRHPSSPLLSFGSLPELQMGEGICISLSIDLSIRTAGLRDPFQQHNDRWQELGWRELPNQFVCSTWYCKALMHAPARSEVHDSKDAFNTELTESVQKGLTCSLVVSRTTHPMQSDKLFIFLVRIYSYSIVWR